MKLPTYYPDGYTRDGYIREVAGHHGALRFTYRPMIAEQRDEVLAVLKKQTPAKYNEVIRLSLTKQIVSWDNTDENGQAVAVSPESIRRLPPALYDKLYLIVAGIDPSDPIEDAPTEERSSYVDDLLAAIGNGQSVGHTREAADAKN